MAYIFYNKFCLFLIIIFQCVRDSRSLPIQTIRITKNHPEMTEWVHPIQKDTPLYISNNQIYTKIAVDRVQTSEKMYNVLLLATGMY